MNNIRPIKRQPHICMRCGSNDVFVDHKSDVVDFKGLTVEVDGLAETACRQCDFRWATAGQEQDNLSLLKEAFAAKRDLVREREGLLTGAQIETVLNQLGVSKAEAASLFGGGPNAFGKYITGDVLQSYPMDRLLRLTLAVGAQALRYLRLGSDAPLQLNAAGYFVAPAVGSNATSTGFSAAWPAGDVPIMKAHPTNAELVEG